MSGANGRHGGPVNGKALPNPVTELMAESLAGRLSRRDMLRRATALGLSAPLIGLMLSAQTRGARAQDAATPPPDPSAGNTIVVPQGLRTDLQGATIAAVLADTTDPNGPFLEAAIARFTEATGITVNFVRGETQADQRLQAYRQQFAGESSDFDVFQIDVIWPGIVAEYAVDLTDSLGETTSQYFEAIVQNNTVDGKLVGIPWYTDAGLLYYRTDLLEKYQLQPPTTWDELQASAQTIQDGERAEGNSSFAGFAWQGRAYEGLSCNGLEWQYSNGGGVIIESDGTVSINNPQAIEAFERARGWVGTISPQDVTTYRETETLNLWTAGNAAFARNWPYMWAASQDAPAVAGMVGVSPLPQGTGENASSAATLGGWQLMVSRFSQNQEPAIEFVRYMTSPEVQTSFAVERSMLPTIGTVYESPDVAAASEFIPRLREVFEGGAVARPSSVSADLYGEVSSIYYTTLNEILSGSTPAADGVASMEEEFNAIMEELG